MAEVLLEQVTKRYPDGTEAVSRLDLAIDDGEFLVLVGPSGCGKTTALRMVAGLEEITEGRIRIGERIVNDVAPKDRDIAMVFQNYALYPHLTVAENMGFGLKLRKVPKGEIQARVREAAKVLGLEDLLERKPRNLSGGQRQRVAMGRAIVREPSAFLMDEPLSNLDAKLRVQMRAEIANIQRNLKVTTLYVTHDQVEAMTMADRVAVMRKGVLQQVAPPQVLYERPCNMFVAGFIGSPAMNLVEATIERDGEGTWAVFGPQRLRLGEELLAERPAIAGRIGQLVALGIRPEAIEDASFRSDAPGDTRIVGDVELVEQMGSEAYVHFMLQANAVVTEDTKELAQETGAIERGAGLGTSGLRCVARVDPRTRARKGLPLEFAVDTRRLYLFDPESGLAIGDDTPSQRATAIDSTHGGTT